MIRTFRCEETERIYKGEQSRKFPPEIQNVARRKLRQLDAAESLDDLRVPPGNRLEQLKGDRDGQWSIRVNDQWRVCFEWENPNNVTSVEMADYH